MQLYEKHRPTTFTSVVGQQKAVTAIETHIHRAGWGGSAYWLSGPSGTGKTTLARIIAHQGAEDLCITEFDSAGDLDSASLDRIDREQHMYGWGAKSGRAYIVNEAHGLRGLIVRRLLGMLERIPSHVVWVFTTTTEGLSLFADMQMDANPLLSRCVEVRLTGQGLNKVFAAHCQRIAREEHLDGKPISAYQQLARDCHNNCRQMLQRISAGQMI